MSAKPWVGQSVVIIDDSASVRDELRRVFEQCGLRVVGVAENGVGGLALVDEHRPDVVSLDLIMPEMDGIECFRKLQEVSPSAKVIVVSWLSGEPKVIEKLADLMPAHIFQTKPVSVADLEARLARLYFPNATGSKPKADESISDMIELGIKVS